MNKSELIAEVAAKAEITKKDADAAVTAVIDAITESLQKGDKVQLVGFGTFEVRERGARTGRDPRTNKEIQIPASKAPAFKAGKALKDTVNNKQVCGAWAGSERFRARFFMHCDTNEEDHMRLDKYLKVSRLIKRRTVANEACDAGRVFVNGKQARASYEVKQGDVLEIQLGERVLKAEVLSVTEYAKKEQAADLYRMIEE